MQTELTENDIIRCSVCDCELVPVKTTAVYLKFRFDVEAPGCPVCGQLYIPEELVRTKIAELESSLEQK